MDTRSSQELPFKLVFVQYDQEIAIDTYYTDLSSLRQQFDQPAATIRENVFTSLRFNCPNAQARLYMDGLESIPSTYIDEDENGQPYISSSDEQVPLFQNDYYPLIPGDYRIKVETGEQSYYASFRVVPKHLNEDQLAVMKEEIDGFVRGLAMDLIRKNLSPDAMMLSNSLPPKLMMQFIVMKEKFPAVMAALTDLYGKVNHRTKKEYPLVNLSKAKVIDDVTIRYRLQHPEDKEYLKTPVRRIHYDLPENRWIKKIIRFIAEITNEFVDAIEQYRENVTREISSLRSFDFQPSTRIVINEKEKILHVLDEYLEIVHKMSTGLQMIQSAPWFSEISNAPVFDIPHVLIYDFRYNTLYQFYRALQEEENIELTLDQQLYLQWKRTDKLYEMWSFLHILKMLKEELGFVPRSGWIYDVNYSGELFVVPDIPEGTTIELQKDHIKIRLKYDSLIPLESKFTEMGEEPIYMTLSHNRPDGRLDIYKENTYMGTLLLEFKYRTKIWQPSLVSSYDRTKVMNQLIAYGNGCRSLYIMGKETGRLLHEFGVNPVQEVWAIYPSKEERNTSRIQSYPDHRLKIMNLSPGQDGSHLLQALLDITEKVANRSGLQDTART